MSSGSEEGFVWFEAASVFVVVLAPVLFHSGEDNRPNGRENLTSERQKKERGGRGGGVEVKTRQRLPQFPSFYIISEGLSTN